MGASRGDYPGYYTGGPHRACSPARGTFVPSCQRAVVLRGRARVLHHRGAGASDGWSAQVGRRTPTLNFGTVSDSLRAAPLKTRPRALRPRYHHCMEIALKSVRLLGFRVLTVGSLLLITVLTARWLGPEGRGVYALVLLYSSVGVTFLGGMGSALAYQVSNLGKPIRAVVWSAVALALIAGTLALLASVVVYRAVGDPDLWWLVVVGAAQPPLLCGAALTWAFLGADDHRGYNRAIIAPSAVSLVLLLALLGPTRLLTGDEASVRVALLAWLLAQCLTVAWLLWLGRRAWFPPDFAGITPASLRLLLLFGVQTGVADLISFLNYRVDVFVLDLLRGTGEVGVYSVAVQAAEGLWFISSAIGVAIYARVGMVSPAEAAELTARSMRHAIFIIALLGLGLVLVAGIAVPFLFGPRYEAAVSAFRLLVPGIVVFGLGRIFSTYFTNALGRPRVPLLIAGTSLVVSVPLCFALIPSLGMNGAALATTISYVVSMALAVVLFSRQTGIRPARLLLITADDLREYLAFARKALASLPGGGAPLGGER